MRQFVWTRFSLRDPNLAARARLDDRDRPKWFQYRADLLKATLIPCLRRQTRPVGGLLLMMDKDDRPLFDEHIGTHDGLVVPFFVKAGEPNTELNAFLSTIDGPITVSRIDSDDLVADNYLECIASCFADAPPGRGPHFCVAASGYISDLRRIQKCEKAASPFISVLYRRFPGKLTLGGRHKQIGEQDPITTRATEWIQIVHGSNVSNTFLKAPISTVSERTWPRSVFRPDLTGFPEANWRSAPESVFSRSLVRSRLRHLRAQWRLLRFGALERFRPK